jgi:DHA2 family multidrug resistance protein
MVVGSGFVQGLGLGLVFVPLTTMTFSNLTPQLRNEGTALYTLVRNIGSSVGVSIVTSLLARNTQANHAAFAQFASPFNDATRLPGYPAEWALQSPATIAALEHEISRQAQLLAYLQDFRFMLWLCILTIPMLLVFAKRRNTAPEPTFIE